MNSMLKKISIVLVVYIIVSFIFSDVLTNNTNEAVWLFFILPFKLSRFAIGGLFFFELIKLIVKKIAGNQDESIKSSQTYKSPIYLLKNLLLTLIMIFGSYSQHLLYKFKIIPDGFVGKFVGFILGLVFSLGTVLVTGIFLYNLFYFILKILKKTISNPNKIDEPIPQTSETNWTDILLKISVLTLIGVLFVGYVLYNLARAF